MEALPSEMTDSIVAKEKQLLSNHGYIKDKDLSTSVQGKLFVAVNQNNNNQPVVIKKISYINNEIYSVSNESIIKKQLLNSNKLLNNNTSGVIVQCTDYFQSEMYFYFVFEYDFCLNLKDFVQQSHEYIANGKLSFKKYKKTIKCLLWRLVAAMYYVNKLTKKDCDSCLGLCLDNIMLCNADFVEKSDGTIEINPEIDLRLIYCDIQIFDCYNISNVSRFTSKQMLYVSPNGNYCNIWSLGMILYFCMLGKFPSGKVINAADMNHLDFGWHAVYTGQIKKYLAMNNIKFINSKTMSLLNGLLNVEQTQRFDIYDVLKHKWFNKYYASFISV